MDKKKIPLVSLFSGAGGLDMGFENQGFQTIWANDFDKDACETHRAWSDAEVIQGDIGQVDFNSIPKTPSKFLAILTTVKSTILKPL